MRRKEKEGEKKSNGRVAAVERLCIYIHMYYHVQIACRIIVRTSSVNSWVLFQQAARYWRNLAKSSKDQRLTKRASHEDLSSGFVSPDDILSVTGRRKAGRTSGSLILHVESDVSLENLGKRDGLDKKLTGMPCRSISALAKSTRHPLSYLFLFPR